MASQDDSVIIDDNFEGMSNAVKRTFIAHFMNEDREGILISSGDDVTEPQEGDV